MQTFFVPLQISLFTLSLLLFGPCYAQERATNETKVIVVVNERSDAVEHIDLLAHFQKLKKEELKDKYEHHQFFLGALKGTYELNKNGITPGVNTIIVLYTDKQFYLPGQSFPGMDLSPGDDFSLGNIKTTVIANKKGELTIKTEGP